MKHYSTHVPLLHAGTMVRVLLAWEVTNAVVLLDLLGSIVKQPLTHVLLTHAKMEDPVL